MALERFSVGPLGGKVGFVLRKPAMASAVAGFY
jgi:hypothetical protein